MIKKMGMAWVTVSDLAKAQKFFVDTLGLKLSPGSAPEWGWLEIGCNDNGGLMIGVAQQNEHDNMKPGSNAVITMTVDNLVEVKQQLEAKGVRFSGEIMIVPGHVKLATFADPDGNVFQLVQELGSK
jgi:predicted enzyme related to lactoylglutathione lyase